MKLLSPLAFDVQREPEQRAFLNTKNGGVLKKANSLPIISVN
jgi:hypothetical protein